MTDTSTELLVVGGGSTGTGVARDAAMRGVDVTLVERGTLTDGTTGRMHGLLHSGARYAVSDRASARECIAENRVLREIAGHCVEPTGGLFVQRPEDPEDYFEEKLRGCAACDVPTAVLSGGEAREREPHLSTEVERAIAVPDAAVDPFRLCVANALDAERRGARIETHARVTDVLVEGGRVVGVEVSHEPPPDAGADGPGGAASRGDPSSRRPARTERIRADHVVNATGAWAGRLAGMAGLEVAVRPSKGAMVVTNVRQVDTVINRCRPKGDADIVVPHETTAILGTTDVPVSDPDDYAEERWEVDKLIDELAELIPLLRDARTLRSFWGVRPLYEPPESGSPGAAGAASGSAGDSGAAGDGAGSGDTADLTRQFFVLDHAERDGVPGMTSVVGGKFTTYRLMAERVTDRVCERLGVDARCRTAEEPLPGSERPADLDAAMERFGLRSPVARRSADRLGSRTADVLASCDPNPVLCPCEAVTRAEVRDAIDQAGPDLNAVRIRTRASMGNCQGAFCCRELAAELHPEHDAATARAALDDLYAERWKGQRHALWGEQLAQAALSYALHATTMNRDGDLARRPDDAGAEVDWDAFDAGPPDDGRTGPGGKNGPTAGSEGGDRGGD